jgi:transposase
MPRHAAELECSTEDRASLVALSKSGTAEARVVERARIILACLEGKEIQQVARELKVSVPSVSKWRQRFSLWGLRGLYDRPRPGKPIKYDTAFRNRVLKLLEESPPPGMSHWDGPAVAEKLNASVHAVWRVLRRQGIYLQRRRSWCVSTDKEFAAKAADVVALYLNPPLNALVLSVDEKPSIQAIERASGYVETDSGKVVRAMKSTYKRHGTLNWFAALESGPVRFARSSPNLKEGRIFGPFWMTCWPINRRTRRSMSSLTTILLTNETMTGLRSSKGESSFTSHRLQPVG